METGPDLKLAQGEDTDVRPARFAKFTNWFQAITTGLATRWKLTFNRLHSRQQGKPKWPVRSAEWTKARLGSWLSNWKLAGITAMVVSLIFFGGYFLLTLAGVFQDYFGIPIPSTKAASVSPPKIDGTIIAAAVTWTGGLAALLTYFYTYHQKERAFAHQKSVEDDKAKRERDLAELQRLESEFAALVKDFASENTLVRLNATIGLAEIAVRPDPRWMDSARTEPHIDEDHYRLLKSYVTEEGIVCAEPIPWPSNWKTSRTTRNFPYFDRATRRLVSALLHYPTDECIFQVVHSLHELVLWAKQGGTDEPLLHLLVNLLADCNRTCRTIVKGSLIRHSENVTSLDIRVALGLDVAPPQFLLIEPNQWAEIVENYLATLVSNAVVFEATEARTWTQEDRALADRLPLLPLSECGSLLNRVKRVCAVAIRALGCPPDSHEDLHEDAVILLQERRGLNLISVVMFGTNCSGSHLDGAFLDHSIFDCATFVKASLMNSRAYNAYFRDSQILETSFFKSNSDRANFEHATIFQCNFSFTSNMHSIFVNASIYKCDFSSANFQSANFEFSHIIECDIRNSSLAIARLVGSTFELVQLEDANLWRAVVQREEFKSLELKNCNWEDASFVDNLDPSVKELRHIPPSKYDRRLWRYLDAQYPVLDGQPARSAPWEKPGAQPA